MGNVPLYLANNIFKIEAGDKLTDDKLFGINGFTTKITMIKSRSNRAGQMGEFVYDQVNGVDNILSNVLYMKNNGKIKGAGVGLYFEGEEDGPTKFRLSNFKEKYSSNKEFRIFCKKLFLKEYRKLINKKDEPDEENNESTKEIVETPKKKTKKKSTK